MKRVDLGIVLALWLGSRLAIFVGLFIVAPMLGPLPGATHLDHPYEAGARWDGAWYGEIVRHGYTFTPDGAQHDVAFFPFFPILVSIVVRAHVPFAIAGMLVANAAFLAMLFVVFAWMQERYDTVRARWVCAVLCLLPMSLFCSIAYAEALFMLATCIALRALDGGDARLGALGGFCAGLTRGPGALLAFPVILRRRPALALAPILGAGAFAAYCWLRFGDALAPVHAQAAWRHGAGFDQHAWMGIYLSGMRGHETDHLALGAAAAAVFLLRDRAPRAVIVGFWLVTIDLLGTWWLPQFENLVIFGVGVAASVLGARTLGRDLFALALATTAIVLFSGEPFSFARIAYGSVAFPIAIALFFGRARYVGFAVLTICAVDLVRVAIVFGRGGWVA